VGQSGSAGPSLIVRIVPEAAFLGQKSLLRRDSGRSGAADDAAGVDEFQKGTVVGGAGGEGAVRLEEHVQVWLSPD